MRETVISTSGPQGNRQVARRKCVFGGFCCAVELIFISRGLISDRSSWRHIDSPMANAGSMAPYAVVEQDYKDPVN